MKQRKWYRKKRFWVLNLFLIYLISIQFEWAKNRYYPSELIQQIEQQTNIKPYLETKIETKTVDSQQVQYLKLSRSKSSPVLLLVHGSPGSLTAYADYYLDEDLLKQFTIIAVDRLGFGYSDFGKSEGNLTNQAKVIAAILKDYPTQIKILVGHSMGGPVIAKLAMDYPYLVDGLLMIAPSISPELEPSNTWRKVLNILPIRLLTPAALRICNQEIIPLYSELTKMLPDWKKIKIPVTVVQGEADALVPQGNADFAKRVLVNSPKVHLHKIKAGNHFILWSEVELIKLKIWDLLSEILSNRGI